jgi:surface protein
MNNKISEKLNIINNAKEDIKTAIENKGVVVGNDSIETYADKINQIVGEEVTKPEQEKTVNPSIEKQTILPDEGFTLSKVEVEAIPVEIKTISNVDFSNESLIITPTNGKYMTSVEILKPTTLIAENIKKDVNVAGIIGTLESGGGADFEINDGSYLFYQGARQNALDSLLGFCKNLTNMNYMFHNCGNVTSIDVSNWDTSNVTNMAYAFYNCSNLENLNVSNFNTDKVTAINDMFYTCRKLKNLDLKKWNVSNVKSLGNTFMNCNALETLDVSTWNTSNVTSISNTFSGCSKLVNLNIGNFDLSKVTNGYGAFSSMSSLVNLTFGTNYGKGFTAKSNNSFSYTLTFTNCTKLTHDSLMSIINNLYDLNLTYNVAGGGTLYTQKLELGSTNLAKLTAEEIAIATNKGWTVS